VLVRYVARQAITFLVGAYLARSAGYELTFTQRAELWSTEDDDGRDIDVAVDEEDLGLGTELGLAFSVTHGGAGHDAAAFAREVGLPVGAIVSLADAGGSGQQAVQSPAHAAALARALAERAFDLRKERKPSAIHVFLAGPGALAGLLGHRWNMMGRTTVYEHTGLSYVPTLTLDW
jgi:hypothetical protein